MIISYIALDVGAVRIGLAVANSVARLAGPLPAITNDEEVFTTLALVVAEQQASELIIGMPRGLDGQQTTQTDYVEAFVQQLTAAIDLPVHMQDEALTSVKAEQELNERGKPYQKGDIDSLSAVYILEDYLLEGVH